MNHADSNTGSPLVKNGGQKKTWLIKVMAILFLLGGVQAATQYFAYTFQYQPQLGAHFNHVYLPWSIFEWGNQWYSQHPDLFQQSASVGVVFAGAGLVLTLIMKMVSDNSSRPNKNLHGSARWAKEEDIQAARLLPATQSLFKKWTAKKTPQNDYVYVGAC